MTDTIELQINGELRLVRQGATVAEVLEQLGIGCTTAVVERNGDIVAKERFADTLLGSGDTLELVRFMGGG